MKDFKKLFLIVLSFYLLLYLFYSASICYAKSSQIEQWGVFEIALKGPSSGNPFTDIQLSAVFTKNNHTIKTFGFYDGNGIYRIRFMPESTGEWHYITSSNCLELNEIKDNFIVVAPTKINHGPVRVQGMYSFSYADGTVYRPIGTTAYAWIHQGDKLAEQTLQTLAASPFNKLRMTVFPKHYEWNNNEPLLYPYSGTAPRIWDLKRFNPEFFQNLEHRVQQLGDLGIEADIILFHPYDKGHWGFDRMPAQADDLYLRYIIARLSAYHNVWWSIANEYDFLKEKKPSDWDRFFQIVESNDPYGHLRSIHNGSIIYNNTLPWVSHASIQNGSAVEDYARAILYRDVYRKPVIFDEVKYEGNIPQRWGNITAQEMVKRFWEGTIAGTFVGHSECFLDSHDIIWWAKGGVLRGQSVERIAFLKKILEDSPNEGLEPIDKWQNCPFAGKRGYYYLGYFGESKPSEWLFSLYKAELKAGMKFKVEVIDTWDMTITPVDTIFELNKPRSYSVEDKNGRSVPLPSKPFIALRIRRIP
jgi:hypothetical protein